MEVYNDERFRSKSVFLRRCIACVNGGTYNDDGTVNVMNLHEVTRTNAGDLVCCIGKPKKTHENIEKRKAFTLTLIDTGKIGMIFYESFSNSYYKLGDRAGME